MAEPDAVEPAEPLTPTRVEVRCRRVLKRDAQGDILETADFMIVVDVGPDGLPVLPDLIREGPSPA